MVEDQGVGQNSEQRYTPLEQGYYFRHTRYEEGEVMPGFGCHIDSIDDSVRILIGISPSVISWYYTPSNLLFLSIRSDVREL